MLTLRLFRCDTLGGNETHEDRFQMFSCRKDNKAQLQVISETELNSLLRQAHTDPFNNSVLRRLGDLLHTSLDEASYELFIDSISVVASMIFYDNLLGSGASVDFEATKRHHYQKYCIYKFASFLDLLHPGSVFWRGQAESASMNLAIAGLRIFQSADAEGRASILSRWIRQPGPSAFSERRATRSQMLQRRGEFLLSLGTGLPLYLTARKLDHEGFKPTKFPSYTVWSQVKPETLAPWLSKLRARARAKRSSKRSKLS
jgi:hypothetical protein